MDKYWVITLTHIHLRLTQAARASILPLPTFEMKTMSQAAIFALANLLKSYTASGKQGRPAPVNVPVAHLQRSQRDAWVPNVRLGKKVDFGEVKVVDDVRLAASMNVWLTANLLQLWRWCWCDTGENGHFAPARCLHWSGWWLYIDTSSWRNSLRASWKKHA